MGKEAVCTARWKNQVSEGRASLESTYLVFRGDFRLKIPLPASQGVEAHGGCLRIRHEDAIVGFALGDQAAKWADAILHPKSRLDKLGVKAGSRIVIAGPAPDDFLAELTAQGATIHNARSPDLTFLFAAGRGNLQKVNAALAPLWIVYPKGVTPITENDVLDAGRSAGLVDVKVASFSSTHTALLFRRPAR